MYKFNPFTANLDYYEPSIQNANATTYFTFDGVGTVNLYINGSIAATWYVSPPTTGSMTGQSIGLLLGLTYA